MTARSLPPPSLTPSLPHAIRSAAETLAGVSDTPRLDAELLAAHALGSDRMDMLANMADLDAPEGYAGLIQRRANHEPVAYITGRQPFWDIELHVTPDVLIPRSDSETLIEVAQQHFAEITAPASILDLGTGSGALLLAAMSLYPEAQGLGLDASAAALAVAKGNADALDMAARCNFARASWHDDGWAEMPAAPFDLILCNPPYIRSDAELAPMVAGHEPHEALFAGADGLDDYRAIVPQIARLLSPHGICCFEIGHDQAATVTSLVKASGLSAKLSRDMAGQPRCIAVQLENRGKVVE